MSDFGMKSSRGGMDGEMQNSHRNGMVFVKHDSGRWRSTNGIIDRYL